MLPSPFLAEAQGQPKETRETFSREHENTLATASVQPSSSSPSSSSSASSTTLPPDLLETGTLAATAAFFEGYNAVKNLNYTAKRMWNEFWEPSTTIPNSSSLPTSSSSSSFPKLNTLCSFFSFYLFICFLRMETLPPARDYDRAKYPNWNPIAQRALLRKHQHSDRDRDDVIATNKEPLAQHHDVGENTNPLWFFLNPFSDQGKPGKFLSEEDIQHDYNPVFWKQSRKIAEQQDKLMSGIRTGVEKNRTWSNTYNLFADALTYQNARKSFPHLFEPIKEVDPSFVYPSSSSAATTTNTNVDYFNPMASFWKFNEDANDGFQSALNTLDSFNPFRGFLSWQGGQEGKRHTEERQARFPEEWSPDLLTPELLSPMMFASKLDRDDRDKVKKGLKVQKGQNGQKDHKDQQAHKSERIVISGSRNTNKPHTTYCSQFLRKRREKELQHIAKQQQEKHLSPRKKEIHHKKNHHHHHRSHEMKSTATATKSSSYDTLA